MFLKDMSTTRRVLVGLKAAACAEAAAGDPLHGRLERIHWLVRVLSLAPLNLVHDQALAEIGLLFEEVMDDAEPAELAHFVRETFDALRRSGLIALRQSRKASARSQSPAILSTGTESA